jgi:signal transduction histidine kinase
MLKKILIVLILNVIVISAPLGIISYIAVHKTIEQSLQNRLVLARIISEYVDIFLKKNLNKLSNVSLSVNINMKDSNWEPEKRMLEIAYKDSLFTEGVFLLDKHGNKLLTYPPHIEHISNLTYINYVNQVIQSGKPVTSNLFTMEPIKKSVLFMMTPLTDRKGRITGIVGGILNPTDDAINKLLRSAKIDNNSYIEIIDSNETVIASDQSSRVLQKHDHDSILSRMIKRGDSGILECRHGFSHPDAEEKPIDRLAFVPLHTAPWGVIVGQSEKDLFAPAIGLQWELAMLMLVFAAISIGCSVVMSNNLVRPLKSLISSANRIASGDLSTPIGNLGSDEILKLSRGFDDMRKKLAESLQKIMIQNINLETRVAIRTEEMRASRQMAEHLLKKAISSQEDERRRVARDLHDTILQDISAFLIKLDIWRLQPHLVTVGTIDEMREIVTKTIDSIHAVIKDLRPSLLDDLGIDAAVMWLLNKHLSGKGINCYLDVESPVKRKRLSPEVEITLFRILQESIVNIARHANAENVFVTLNARGAFVEISIEDDGDGFDSDQFMRFSTEDGRGLGVIGMKERASLIGGELEIRSKSGEGTRICLKIPLKGQEQKNV